MCIHNSCFQMKFVMRGFKILGIPASLKLSMILRRPSFALITASPMIKHYDSSVYYLSLAAVYDICFLSRRVYSIVVRH